MGLEGPYDQKTARGKKRTAMDVTTIRNRISPQLNRTTEDTYDPQKLITELESQFQPAIDAAAEKAMRDLFTLKWAGSLNKQIKTVEDLSYIVKRGSSSKISEAEKINFLNRSLPSYLFATTAQGEPEKSFAAHVTKLRGIELEIVANNNLNFVTVSRAAQPN